MIPETGLMDLSASCLEVSGKDSRDFLNRILTNDIKTLRPKKGSYNCICDRKGKILADLYCYACQGYAYQDYFRIHCAFSLKEKILNLLTQYIIIEDVQVKDISTEWGGACAVIGPGSQAAFQEVFPALPDQDLSLSDLIWNKRPYLVIHRNRWSLEGYDIWAEKTDLAELKKVLKIPRLTEERAEMMRIETLTPLYGVDMDEHTIPQEACLYDALNFKKGCYVGQETIARLENLGHVNKELCLLTLEGRQLPQKGDLILTPDQQEAGFVTSSCLSEKQGSVIALGYIKYIYRELSAFYVNGQKAKRCGLSTK